MVSNSRRSDTDFPPFENVFQTNQAAAAKAATDMRHAAKSQDALDNMEADTETAEDSEQNFHTLYDATALNDLIAEKIRVKAPQDDKELMFLKRMQASRWLRPLAPVPDNYQEIARQVMEDAPNFSDWIENFLIPELALAKLTGGPFKLTPTLFVGDAGAGKTRFCEVLAKAFDIPSVHRNLETEQSSAGIIGSARFWSNTKPGAIFDYFVQGGVANPMFVFEELDKAAGTTEYPVISSFYQLLEPTSARKFCDSSTPDLALDILPVSWLFTANGTGTIPHPILTRLNVVHVPSLTVDQTRDIALKQFAAMVVKLGNRASELRMTDAALDALSAHSPRQQRMLLLFAIGRAIANGHTEVRLSRPEQMQRLRPGFI